MNRNVKQPLTETDIEDYERAGMAAVRGVFDADWVRFLGEAADTALTAGHQRRLQVGQKGETFAIKSDLLDDHPAFRTVVFDSPAPAVAAALMRARKVNYYGASLFVKEPGSVNAATPWHQDQPYFQVDGWQICSVWIALDPVTIASGAVGYVVGSHRWGKWFRPVSFGGAHNVGDTPFSETVPDIDGGGFEIVRPELAPGDCLVHHGLALHGGAGNSSSSHRRRGLSIRFVGEDARYVARGIIPGRPRAPLNPGDPMDCALYPQVWPRAAGAVQPTS